METMAKMRPVRLMKRFFQRAAEWMAGPKAVIPIPRSEREWLLAKLLATDKGALPELSLKDRARLIERITLKTRLNNQDNLARTRAYLRYYERHRNVHWAFLAHMVSRNGGWRMTDLAGGLLPKLLSDEARLSLFEMLEHANALIFGDAYPQLLLYEESLREGRPLFSLLPAFGVSRFMQAVWERFWTTGNSALLTAALIINEQHFIEGRIVAKPKHGGDALASLPSRLQSLMRMNQVLLPCGGRDECGEQRLAGLAIADFADLAQRIETGKALYAMLFAIPEVARGAEDFAKRTPHTGSRADYWPRTFTPDPAPLSEAGRLWSPRLHDAWNKKPLLAPERYDWLRDPKKACSYLTDAAARVPAWMNAEARAALRALTLAAAAGAKLPQRPDG